MEKPGRIQSGSGKVSGTAQRSTDKAAQKTKVNKPAPLEKSVVKAILKFLNNLPQCRAVKVSGDAKKSGEPDIDGCLAGRSLKIEVKRPGNNRVTDLQTETLEQWKAAGAITGVVHSVEEVKDLLKEVG